MLGRLEGKSWGGENVDEDGTWSRAGGLSRGEIGVVVMVEGEQVDGRLGLEAGVGSRRVGRLKEEGVDALVHSGLHVDYVGPLVERKPGVDHCCPWFSALGRRAVRMKWRRVGDMVSFMFWEEIDFPTRL